MRIGLAGATWMDLHYHRAWVRTEGFTNEVFQSRPVIGISNSWSVLTNCNVQLRLVAEAVKRGVWQAGGFPLEFPTMSLGEALMKPTAMLYRNLMSMDVEETIRANPIDGVVMLAGCDKTVPANLMGAASCNVPALMITGGPMLNGHWRKQRDRRQRCLAHQRRTARRTGHRRRSSGSGKLHGTQRRTLHGNGNGFDDGVHG